LIEDFAKALPAFRKKSIEYLKTCGWNREKVLALVYMTLDECGIRIGNASYAKRNQTCGLTTLRRKHVGIKNDELNVSFKGKKGVQREVEIHDDELTKLIKKSAGLPGYEIFRHKEGAEFHNVDSHDVNEYIR
jgi:DNA topoisomerase-1